MSSRNIRRILSVLLIAVLLTAGIVPAAFASVPAKVNTSKAKVFKSANKWSASLKVPKNLQVNITAISGGWAKVEYKGNKAYIPLKWLSPAAKKPAYVNGSSTVYNAKLKAIGKVSSGKGVYALGTIGNYYLIMNPSNGALAYIGSGRLSSTKPSNTKLNSSAGSKATTKKPNIAEEDTASELIEKMLDYADSLIGKPYSKIDCSSFVRMCMEHVHLAAKDTAARQADDSNYDKIKGISNIQRGDILCFDTSGNGAVDHTGFYLGSNWFIESSRIGGQVHYNYMTEFYQNAFKWARRINK